jgi:hypothetical protein
MQRGEILAVPGYVVHLVKSTRGSRARGDFVAYSTYPALLRGNTLVEGLHSVASKQHSFLSFDFSYVDCFAQDVTCHRTEIKPYVKT